jgi:hypothetical protein
MPPRQLANVSVLLSAIYVLPAMYIDYLLHIFTTCYICLLPAIRTVHARRWREPVRHLYLLPAVFIFYLLHIFTYLLDIWCRRCSAVARTRASSLCLLFALGATGQRVRFTTASRSSWCSLYTRSHTHTHTHICMLLCMYVCTYMCVYVYMYIYIYVYIYICICIYVCMYVCMYAYIYIYIYTYIHKYIHIYKYV